MKSTIGIERESVAGCRAEPRSIQAERGSTEWRPREIARRFGTPGGAAIGELIVRHRLQLIF